MNDTPNGSRTHIAFFGLRNAGKSTLVNALTGQEIAIVSDVAGTTTDPVSKAMEILPLGPCLVTDTAGLDDVGELGEERVRRTLEVLERTDVAVWVEADSELVTGHRSPVTGGGPQFNDGVASENGGGEEKRQSGSGGECHARFRASCEARGVPVLVYRRGESVEDFKKRIAAVKLAEAPRPLVGDLLNEGDMVVCVCPIDESAPKGRLILPQQQVIREILDAGATALVCQPAQLSRLINSEFGIRNSELATEAGNQSTNKPIRLVITDSQAFGEVSKVVPEGIPLTSFSIIFARAKGDLEAYCAGAEAMGGLREGDRVLIAEGCTHHRQCNDIGTVKLPRWVERHAGCSLRFDFCSGNAFPADLSGYALVIQCGGCMLTRRAVQARIQRCRAAGVPITNYGVAIAVCHNVACLATNLSHLRESLV